jgi:2-polyprenyl-3-methyl-5-hydroxy-6-metoxy-1,4-benzoquinol methylase
MIEQHYDQSYFAAQLSKSDAKVAWQYGRIFDLAGVGFTRAPLRVLDVGCGAGPALRFLLARGQRAVGVDLVYYPLAEARRLAPAAGLAQADVSGGLPFASGGFDLLLLSEIVEHLRDEQPLLRECRRVLRPGGRIVVTTPNLWDARRALAPLGGPVWSGDTDPTHCNLFTPPRLGAALRAAGFTGVRWRTGIKPMRWLSSRRLRLRLALPYPPLVGNGLLAVGLKAE